MQVKIENLSFAYGSKKLKVKALDDISLNILEGEFFGIIGHTGSGKSTLAFDTIFAEGQRRYMESLSSYARQFLGQMSKPNVDSIEGLTIPRTIITKPAINHFFILLFIKHLLFLNHLV